MILITGADGRLGSRMAAHFLGKKLKIRLMCRKGPVKIKNVHSAVADLFDMDSLLNACKGVDTVIHLAGTLDYTLPQKEMIRINGDGTKNMLEAASLAGVSKFVYASSVAVYGDQKKFPITEDFKLNPKEPYGTSKMMAEDYIKKSGMDYTILRPTAVYGNGFDIGLKTIFKLIETGKMRIIGDGKNKIHFVHAEDCLRAFYLAATKKAFNDSFNIAGPEVITQGNLMALLANNLGVEPPKKHISKNLTSLAANAAYHLLRHSAKSKKLGAYLRMCRWVLFFFDTDYDISKARRVLGYRPVINYQRGLRAF